jgi:hypothetical protein
MASRHGRRAWLHASRGAFFPFSCHHACLRSISRHSPNCHLFVLLECGVLHCPQLCAHLVECSALICLFTFLANCFPAGASRVGALAVCAAPRPPAPRHETCFRAMPSHARRCPHRLTRVHPAVSLTSADRIAAGPLFIYAADRVGQPLPLPRLHAPSDGNHSPPCCNTCYRQGFACRSHVGNHFAPLGSIYCVQFRTPATLP